MFDSLFGFCVRFLLAVNAAVLVKLGCSYIFQPIPSKLKQMLKPEIFDTTATREAVQMLLPFLATAYIALASVCALATARFGPNDAAAVLVLVGLMFHLLMAFLRGSFGPKLRKKYNPGEIIKANFLQVAIGGISIVVGFMGLMS